MSDSTLSSDEGAISYALLGILLMLDITFICNYYVIKALRSWTDAFTKEDPPDISKPVRPQSKISQHLETFLFGCILGKVKPLPLSLQRFPLWRPIPHKLHLVTTCILVLIALMALSPQYFEGYIGVDLGSVTLSTQFCKSADIDAGIKNLYKQIEEITNYINATKQYEHMNIFSSALANDTTRYGTKQNGEDFICPGNDGDKSLWQDLTKPPASENGPFFPGYCQEAQKFAIESALSAECKTELCECPRMPSTGATRFFQLDGLELCFMRVCANMPKACPAHTNDAEVNLDNYREQQLAQANSQETPTGEPTVGDVVQDVSTAALQALLKQVDVASNLYSVYVCVSLWFPSPLVVFRMPYMIAIKRFLFGQEKWTFIFCFVAIWFGIEYFGQLWRSPDFQLFLQNLKAGDPCWLDGSYMKQRQQVINEVCANFTPQENIFDNQLAAVKPMLFEINAWITIPACNCKFPMVDTYELRTTSTSGDYTFETLEPLGFGNSSYPNQFCSRRDSCTVLTPNSDIEYIGNRTLCTDSEFARELALQAPDQQADWSEITKLWISSGLIASFLVKVAMTNYALALLRMADPFVVCSGEFFWIPSKLGDGLGGRSKSQVFAGFRKNKESTLRTIAFKGAITWGLIMHMCIVNLMYTAYSQYDNSGSTASPFNISQSDAVILSFCMSVSGGVIAGSICFIGVLRARKNIVLRRLRKKQNGDDSDEDNDEDA